MTETTAKQNTGPTEATSMPKVALYVAAILFAAGAVGHLVRLFTNYQIIIGSIEVPIWVSFPGAAVAAALAAWMAASARRVKG